MTYAWIRNRPLAVVVAAVFLAATSSVPAADPAAGGAVFEGRVVEADGVTPREGVVVTLAEGPEGPSWDSAPSAPDGSFRVDAVPSGEYAVLLRDGGGAYLASDRVEVLEGESRPVAVAIHPGVAPAQSQGGGIPRWGEWLIVGALVVAGGFVVNEIVTKDDTERPSSPF